MMSNTRPRFFRGVQKALLLALSAIAGLVLVFAAFKFDTLGWIVDGPGWLVSRFTSIDFHEGDGALGFLLAVFLSWLWTSVVVYFIAAFSWHKLGGSRRLDVREGH
jgi:hypothetical protein